MPHPFFLLARPDACHVRQPGDDEIAIPATQLEDVLAYLESGSRKGLSKARRQALDSLCEKSRETAKDALRARIADLKAAE